MGLHNRPYMRGDGEDPGGPSLSLPRPTGAALGLIVACAAVLGAALFTGRNASRVYDWLALMPRRPWEVWRLLTFQFLHAGAGHFVWNMLGLYFFGPPLERRWGAGRFLAFYLVCGTVSGLCFLGMVGVWPGTGTRLVGASGGILACLTACAILFPQLRVLFFPIRWVAVFFFVLYGLSVAFDRSLSDAAHLGGMVAAVAWLWGLPGLGRGWGGVAGGLRRGAWARRQLRRQALKDRIDRILRKVHDEGLASLSGKEKKLLQDATRLQREEDRSLRRP